MNIADFAALVGTTPKTIYDKINNYSELPVNEQLSTVIEKVKGRSIKLIVTNSEQIEYFKNLYGKNTVNEREYYETLTDNNGVKRVNEVQNNVKFNDDAVSPDNIIERLLTLNDNYNERLERYNEELLKSYNELATVKSKQLLLEDKASREGLYINEINDLKKENHRNKLFINLLITVIIGLLLLIIGFITYNIGVNNHNSDVGNKVEGQVEQVP